ncbi:ribosomal RNA processing protein 36 homolog [Sceloporus undulatus]|uniref:ribosomal RNA processing protein 36 homolog n=1 Tax=Sceloporus undulatus TaxID=8520 RepID=UPI001C4B01C6|nr:ribosomal RNA processing protein 36 homolog [Sceloporus undulatus]
MKQRGNKPGDHAQKKSSSSGRDGSTPIAQASDDSEETNILNPKLLTQKRPLQVSSSMGDSSMENTDGAKRQKLLPKMSSSGHESGNEESDDSDYEQGESDNDVSDETSSEDDDDDDICSDASEGDEDSKEKRDQTSSKTDLTKELSSMSFEEILQLRNQVGMKAYQRMTSEKRAPSSKKPEKRQWPSKDRPLEISAKKPVSFLRKVVLVKKKVPRDPRFDDLSGEYKPEVFEKTYGFLNDIRKKEKEIVQKQLKKSKNVDQQTKLQQLLKRMTQQEVAHRKIQEERERDLAFKKEQRELAKQGKKPFYLKKSDKQKWELAEKYKELKRSGKLESFLSKKRKRNAAKDKRKLPFKKNL